MLILISCIENVKSCHLLKKMENFCYLILDRSVFFGFFPSVFLGDLFVHQDIGLDLSLCNSYTFDQFQLMPNYITLN